MKKIKKIVIALGLSSLSSHLLFIVRRVYSCRNWLKSRSSAVICLELGSGPKKGKNGWITVDTAGSDIVHDLRHGIPFETGSVERIYTSHLLEHIPYEDLIIFLAECHRVLKRGGELSVCVPNSAHYIKAYMTQTYFRSVDKLYQPASVDTGSFLDQVNYIAYMNQLHKYMFDEQNLVNTLKKVPFSSVGLRNFDASLDMESRRFESIYALAVK